MPSVMEPQEVADSFLSPVRAAEEAARQAEYEVRRHQAALTVAPWSRRRAMSALVDDAMTALDAERSKVALLEAAAEPHVTRIHVAEANLHRAEHEVSLARISDRLDRLTLEPPSRTIDRGVSVDGPGL
jgi:hypothetical protein